MADSSDWALEERIDICIACCYTPTYNIKDDRGTIAKAREVLDCYNIGLWVWPEDSGGAKGSGSESAAAIAVGSRSRLETTE